MRAALSAIGTVWRGLRARGLLSVGSVLLVVLAVASALLGPTFAESVARSYVVTRLNEAPQYVGGQSWHYTPTQHQPPERAIEQALEAVEATSPGPFRSTVPQLESSRFAALKGWAFVMARGGVCAHLVLASGRCSAGPDEAMMAEADREYSEVRLGDEVDLGLVGAVRIVGFYEPLEQEDDYWFVTQRLASIPVKYLPDGSAVPPKPGPVIVDASRFATLRAPWRVRVDRLLDIPAGYTAADLRDALATRSTLDEQATYRVDGGRLRAFSLNDLEAITADVSDQQRTASASVAPAVLSLILVALVLLMRLLTTAADLRVPELALAALRGMSSRRMWLLGLSEPLLLVVIGVLPGLGLGVLSARLLARWWLVPGLPVPLSGTGLLAVAGVVVAAALVSVGVVAGVLRRSLAGQLSGVTRPTRPSRAAAGLELFLVAVAVAMLAGQFADKQGDPPDATDLLLPVLLAAAVGLVTSRAVVMGARWRTRARASSRWLPGYVARRAVARRREGTLVVLPLAAAIAVGVFSLGMYDAGVVWRSSVAATIAPAGEVWLSADSTTRTRDLTTRLDPEGEWLMSAATVRGRSLGLVLLDTSRLATVADWPAEWTPGRSAASVSGLLGPRGRRPRITGTTVGLTASRDLEADGEVWVGMTMHVLGRTDPLRVMVGPWPPGTHTRTAEVPECRRGCVWEELAVGGAATLPRRMVGRLSIGGLTVDGKTVADAVAAAAWAEADAESAALASADLAGGRLNLDIDSGGEVATVRFLSGARRVFQPVVLGENAADDLEPMAGGRSYPLWVGSLPVEPVLRARSVPFLGPQGVAIDSTIFTSGRELYEHLITSYVLARADMPPEIRRAMVREGLTLVTTRAREQRILDRTAYALALRLYLVVAAVVIAMAMVGLLVSTVVQMPARRRDAAALRVVGVRRRAIVAAVVWEVLVVHGAAAVAGILAGSLAQRIVLRTVTVGYAETINTPRPISVVDIWWLALVSLGTVAVLAFVAATGAALTVRGARGASLREGAS